jgi:hypothetical protein
MDDARLTKAGLDDLAIVTEAQRLAAGDAGSALATIDQAATR